jgi:ATP-dependent Lhr-like helicase
MERPGASSSERDRRAHGEGFHPAVARWFARRFPEGPTVAQERGWQAVRSGAHTLIAAPTGSGKTLAGFLVAIDAAYRAHQRGRPAAGTALLYISPLRALAVDIEQNLLGPLAEIAECARELGLDPPQLTVGVRTGDSSAGQRAALLRRPPTFLVSTPESLYLMLTAAKARATLTGVRTVIVDEIHALARDKRGVHLALSLERLNAIQQGASPQRIGLSATQQPIGTTAKLLGGTRAVEIVDCGHARELELSIELPERELEAVISSEAMAEVVARIAAHVARRRTTLIFVNTRRLAERIAHMLAQHLPPDLVAAHHGSLSVQRRRATEERLRAGALRALVATASLELGIDVGPVELVCQIGSPRSIATLLQRVGRANHSRHGRPRGILYPLSRDELVECAALLSAIRAGRLDGSPPVPLALDILAQQIVAEVAAAGECSERELFDLVKRAGPYAELGREQFEELLELTSEGIPTGSGRRMAHIHRDRIGAVLRPRRGARLAALTSGGAIAELGDFRVVVEPEDVVVGAVNEDFALESMVGDVFLLGTHSWRVRRVAAGEVRVIDAQGANPTIPFWIGEAPARTAELCRELSDLRGAVSGALERGREHAIELVGKRCGIDRASAKALVGYLAAARSQLPALPTLGDVVFERFFDEAGGMQLVVHAPFGARINRAFALALRKRFCVTFDFELQAAASDDALLISLGPQHSFPLAEVVALLPAARARAALEQALLPSPMFSSRWRWNLNRALAVLRFRGGKKSPVALQRMEAEDLLAAVFPALAACQENAPPGPIGIPDHPLVAQTVRDCLEEAMDVAGLEELLGDIASGRVRSHFIDSTEPSLLAHEILGGKPFTFLDDAPLEERRSRAVPLPRGLPVEPADLGELAPEAIAQLSAEVAPSPRDREELHDLLLSCVLLAPRAQWSQLMDALIGEGRAVRALVGGGGALAPAQLRWCARERIALLRAIDPEAKVLDGAGECSGNGAGDCDREGALARALRGHLELCGPVSAPALAAELGIGEAGVQSALARLQAEGFALRGSFLPGNPTEQWCARRLLARVHAYTRRQRRNAAALRPLTPSELICFLLRWQGVAPKGRFLGRSGLRTAIDRLQGFEAPAGAWEEAILPARLERYEERWLDELCLAGEIVWGRFAGAAPHDAERRRGARTPSRATPISFALRADLPWLLAALRGEKRCSEPRAGAAHELLQALRRHGALFAFELATITGRLEGEVAEGLFELIARGLVSADSFDALRALFRSRARPRHARPRRYRSGPPGAPARLGGRRSLLAAGAGAGRWSLLGGVHERIAPMHAAGGSCERFDSQTLAEQVAGQLLARWGILCYELFARESFALPWREILAALRRFEARGVVVGGRFAAHISGEQYALVEAHDELRSALRRGSLREQPPEPVRIGAADPLNLLGTLLPGARPAARRGRFLTYRDGAPELEAPPPGGAPAARTRSLL